MPLSEFDMIAKYFRGAGTQRADTPLAIGDDSALIRIDAGQQLVTCLLQWQQGVDYNTSDPAAETGRRFLDQALVEMRALQAKPTWMTLSLSFVQLHEAWLKEFSQGLLEHASAHDVQLIGGDSSRGPETLRIHVLGTCVSTQTA